jgi:hypothetical protein
MNSSHISSAVFSTIIARAKWPAGVNAKENDPPIASGRHRQCGVETGNVRRLSHDERYDSASSDRHTNDAGALVGAGAEAFRRECENRRKHDRVKEANRKQCPARERTGANASKRQEQDYSSGGTRKHLARRIKT